MYNLRNSRKDFLRSQNVARKRRKKRLIKLSIKLGLIVLFIGVVGWLSWLDNISIRNVVVIGNSSVESAELQSDINAILDDSYFFIFSKRNAFIYPKEEISELVLKRYPKVEDVVVKTEGLSILNVVIEERTPLAIWCGHPDCYYLDKNAFVFEKIDTSQSRPTSSSTASTTATTSTSSASSVTVNTKLNLITFHGNDEVVGPSPLGKNVFEAKLYEDMIATAKMIEELGLSVSDITYKEKNSIVFDLKNNGRIILSEKKSFEESLDNLKSALSSSVFMRSTTSSTPSSALSTSTHYNAFEYVDLRYGNKVFYRMSGKVDSSSTISTSKKNE